MHFGIEEGEGKPTPGEEVLWSPCTVAWFRREILELRLKTGGNIHR